MLNGEATGSGGFMISFLGLIMTFVFNGYVIRSGMDPKKPVDFGNYFVFLFLLAIFLIVFVFLLFILMEPFIGSQNLEILKKQEEADPKAPFSPELIRLSLIIFFVMGSALYYIIPIFLSKLSILKGLRELPNCLRDPDYFVASLSPFVILFFPILLRALISNSKEMMDSFFGQILSIIIFFLIMTADIYLQYPTYYLLKKEKKSEEDPISN
ncbi:hypothetical protein [Leptospira sarikeiensis]|nr:hypothetical protein [Leptospira sarikeiensis]